MADASAVTRSTPSWQVLQERRERFLTVNEGRLARLRDSLQSKQRQCLDLIPLLFHTNLPQAPGYVDDPETPTGVVDYTPAPGTVQMLQVYQRAVKPADLRPFQPRILSLYLMGSSGSIAQSTTSDLDIWVCHASDLTGEQVRLLEYKAHALTQWAEGFNLEVHFFLMDAHRFQGNDQRSLTGENCGSTQHFLLLDEFYRTGQLLAGATPAWWLVPTEDEAEYADTLNTLQEQGLLRLDQTIDFGPIPQLPPGEFIGAGLWQLYKGIDSPHKSVLKLLLLEVYAREFPDVTSLAHRYKDAIHSNFLTLNDLDPYAMLYHRIEVYLKERGETDRLELVRRCFYFKVGIAMSRQIRSVGWRRRLMRQMVEDWQWSDGYLAYLDGYRNWPVQDVMRERKLLINELTHSYRFLTQFAADHQSSHLMSQQDLLILSRKLHAAFDRRRGKIDFISLGQDVDLSHEKVQIHEVNDRRQSGQTYWAAYSQSMEDTEEPIALKKTPGLLETLLWCHLNGLLEAHLHIPVFARHQELTEFEVRKTLATLRQAMPTDEPLVRHPNYLQPALIERVVLFINLGSDPLKHLTDRGLQKISARSNSLDFSALRENLVATLDMVTINSWGEVMVERFSGDEALPDAIQFLLTRLGKPNQPQPRLECFCHNQTRPHAIAKRVQDLISDAVTSLYESLMGRPVRFLYNLGAQYRALSFAEGQIHPLQFDTEPELVEWLGNEHPSPSLIRPDRLFDTPRSLLKTVLKEQPDESAVTLVYRLTDRQATLYLLDEHGSLLRFRQPFFNKPTLLAPLVRFLRITEHRQRSEEDAFHLHQRAVNCYELVGKGAQDAKLNRVRLTGLMQEGRFINLQAVMDRSTKGRYEYQMICNDKEFSTIELGEQFYPAVASYVLGLRAQGHRYPVYITDLALTDRVLASLPYGRAQTMHFVKAKLKLEKRINDAMTKL